MNLDRVPQALLIAGVILVGAIALVQIGVVSTPWSEDRTTVGVLDDDGTTKATVDVEIADTYEERYTGLSDHESLADGEGMLFVHPRESEKTYVMREMDFAIDIIFIGSDGEITTIHHARAPEPGEDGSSLRYSGQAKWVLEVPRGYANETGIETGDEVTIPESGEEVSEDETEV